MFTLTLVAQFPSREAADRASSDMQEVVGKLDGDFESAEIDGDECNHWPCCEDGSTLKYEGHYGAPGIGYSTKCTVCERNFAVVGDDVSDPSEGRHILLADDVI